ncbi:MAG: hypothetical protein Q9218_007906 [Villophora microphyllina]
MESFSFPMYLNELNGSWSGEASMSMPTKTYTDATVMANGSWFLFLAIVTFMQLFVCDFWSIVGTASFAGNLIVVPLLVLKMLLPWPRQKFLQICGPDVERLTDRYRAFGETTMPMWTTVGNCAPYLKYPSAWD